MHSKSDMAILRCFAAAVFIAMMLATLPADARSGANRSINLAGQQRMLIEQMTNGTMLAVLGIDTQDNIRAIRSARSQFRRTLRGLRDGDDGLGLNPTSTPEVLAEIAEIEQHWPRYDQTLQTVVTSVMTAAQIDHSHIRELAEIQELIIAAVDRTVGAFEHYAHGGDGHSILSTTINGAGRLRTLAHQIMGEVLAIAYQFDVTTNRDRLAQSVAEFDRTLNGLIHGDGELHLLPAATQEISSELTQVQALWVQLKPLLDSIGSGSAVGEGAISQISRSITRMIRPVDAVSTMYENL